MLMQCGKSLLFISRGKLKCCGETVFVGYASTIEVFCNTYLRNRQLSLAFFLLFFLILFLL